MHVAQRPSQTRVREDSHLARLRKHSVSGVDSSPFFSSDANSGSKCSDTSCLLPMAGTELPSVVDEDDDRVPDPGLGKTFRWDDFFPYTTYKMVKIKDRWLGLLYWSIVTAVVFYIIVVAVVIEGKHQTRAHGVGIVITRFWGKAFLGQKALDVTDLRSPLIEPTGAFIMTKRIVVNQTQGKRRPLFLPGSDTCSW